jgi:predicted aspartyl protease
MKNTHFAAVATAFAVLVTFTASPARSQSPALSQSDVKFRLSRDSSIILVPVKVNGQGPFEFILDTGADDVVLDASLARRVSVETSDSARQATIAGGWAPDRSVADSLQVGPARVKHTPVLLTDLSVVRAAVPEAQGVLGQGFLSQFNYLLDYQHRSIRFEQGDEIQDSIHGEPVPSSLDAHRMIVYAQVEAKGSHAVRLLLDSGANTLVLSRASAEASHVALDAARVETTVNAKVALPSGRVPQLMVGLRRLRDLPVAITSAQQMQQICDGLLPASLFKALYINNSKGFVEILDTDR